MIYLTLNSQLGTLNFSANELKIESVELRVFGIQLYEN